MAGSNVPITAGSGTLVDTYQVGSDHRQLIIPSDHGGFRGRFTTFRTLGRAGTAGQNLAAIWNATGSTIAVDVNFVGVDLVQTVIKAVTVEPPLIRLIKLTTIPTNGSAGSKVSEDSGLAATSASVSTFQDSSAENTGSGTTLAFTQTAATSGLTQEFAPRLITAAGYEPADRVEFLNGGPITLRAAEGVGVRLDYTLATMNPVTDKWAVTFRWEEYTP